MASVTPESPPPAVPTDAASEKAVPEKAKPDQAGQTPPDDVALLDAALKRTDLIWVGPDAATTRAVWQVWDDGAVYLLCGGGEQAAPVPPGQRATVVVASKDKRTRLLTFTAAVEQVDPGADWDRITGQMVTRRLNLPDGEAAPGRWAGESMLLRLRPDLPLLERPGHYDAGSHAAPPPPTTATTRVPRPWHLFGRPQRRR